MSSKKLVAYFSAGGVTKKLAEKLAAATDADLYEIKPVVPYTAADLDWRDKNSRTTIEMNDPAKLPAMKQDVPDMAGYDTVFIGFPIWWYTAPTIIHTFLKSCDLSGKKAALFATSGSSGMGDTMSDLKAVCPKDVRWLSARRFGSSASESELKAWADGLDA